MFGLQLLGLDGSVGFVREGKIQNGWNYTVLDVKYCGVWLLFKGGGVLVENFLTVAYTFLFSLLLPKLVYTLCLPQMCLIAFVHNSPWAKLPSFSPPFQMLLEFGCNPNFQNLFNHHSHLFLQAPVVLLWLLIIVYISFANYYILQSFLLLK